MKRMGKNNAERTRILEGYELKVIRFTNDEVLHDFEAVCDREAPGFA